MNKDFVKNNPNKKFFSLREIILQVYDDSDKNTLTEEYFYRNKIRIIEPVLKSLGIDIESYKSSSNRYRIPLFLAELVYILTVEAENCSSKSSCISFLKSEDYKEISVNDKLSIIIRFFDEISKDFPFLKEINDNYKSLFSQTYYYYINIDLMIDKLISIRDKIDVPLIRFDEVYKNKRLKEYKDCLDKGWLHIIMKDGTEIIPNNQDDNMFDSPQGELLEFYFSIRGTEKFLPILPDTENFFNKLLSSIESIERNIDKAISCS